VNLATLLHLVLETSTCWACCQTYRCALGSLRLFAWRQNWGRKLRKCYVDKQL